MNAYRNTVYEKFHLSLDHTVALAAHGSHTAKDVEVLLSFHPLQLNIERHESPCPPHTSTVAERKCVKSVCLCEI